MVLKIFLLFFVLALLVTGCAAPLGSLPGQAETSKPTMMTKPATLPIIIPTLTPEPSVTPTVAPTPEPPLKTSGPYLAYFRYVDKEEKYVDGAQELVLMDADGVGRKVITLPSENRADLHFISPDGKWLAYYLGSANKDKASDMTLNLLDLESGESRLVSNLLSKNYPDNFIEAAKALNDPFVTANDLKQTFISGITSSVGWSPDGYYLAFAGQMDGLSSDAYLYDLAKGTLRRLTHGPEEIQEISWSPDGKWILSSSATRLGEDGVFAEDAIALDSFTMKSLPYRTYGLEREWYNRHTYVDYEAQNGIGYYDLRSVDIETGKVLKIWDGAFLNFVLDSEKALVVIFPLTFTWPQKPDEDLPGGPYLVDIQAGRKIKLDQGDLDTFFFGLGNRRFLTRYNDEEAFFISADGTVTPTDPKIDNVSLAPDKQHWVSIGKTLKIFDANDNILHEIPSLLGEKDFPLITWKPDSSGLFIAIGKKLYALDIPSGKMQLVETSLTSTVEQDLTFTWVGKK